MPKKIEWTESEMKRMFDLRELGCTYEEIGFELGAGITTVWKYINSERYKKYLETNKQKLLAKSKEYYELNKEKIANKKKEYNESNKDKMLAYLKEYREANKEKIKEKRKEY